MVDCFVKQGDTEMPFGIEYLPPEAAEDVVRVTYRVQTKRYRYSGELPVRGGLIPLPPNLPAGEVFFAEAVVEWPSGACRAVGWDRRYEVAR